MSRTKTLKSRAVAALAALAATVAGAALLASPAAAASADGEAFLKPAQHDKGRTLSGQGVAIVAGSGATAANAMLSLPLSSLEGTTAGTSASLSFERGKKSVSLTAISFDLAKGTLNGSLGGKQQAVFNLGGAVTTHPGGFSLQGGKLSLTATAAAALKQQLGLERALVRRAVGMVWLSAQLTPATGAAPATPVAPAGPRAVSAGNVDWGVLASFRKYILGNFGPGSVGTITTEGGATANGVLSEPSAFFSLPASGGSFDQASGQLGLATAGALVFAKPGHCIMQVRFSGIEVDLAGAASKLVLDANHDIDSPAGKTCVDKPAVATDDVDFASLDLSAVAPTYSADGNTATWTAVPATLTAAGEAAWGMGAPYLAGKALDPVTITANLK
jgi:Htaa protein